MTESEHRERVREQLVELFVADRAPTRVLPMSALGLIEMTRKRVRESAVTGLTERCFYCEGRGQLASFDVLIDGILSRVRQLASTAECTEITVNANPMLIERLVEDCEEILAQIETDRSVKVSLESIPEMHLEQVEVR
jgi:ribonuclease G